MKYNFKNVKAEYTGGGIYIFLGEFADGKFFLTDDYGATLILDEDPADFDESLYPEWQEKHLIEELMGPARLSFLNDMLDTLKASNPDNITDLEIDRYKAEWNNTL